jgi:outer membrane protein assembly factor BamE (lipoprotein component of BamABCDE complex)
MGYSHSMIRSTLALLLVLAACPGCAWGPGSHEEDLSPEASKLVEPGMTKRQVSSVFGAPHHVTTLADGRELWKYSYRIDYTKEGKVHRPVGKGDRARPDGYIHAIFVSDGTLGVLVRK